MGTNIVLAIILLVVLLFTSTLFNETLESNRDQIEGYIGRFTAPFRPLGGMVAKGWRAMSEGRFWIVRVAGPVAALSLTTLIYCFHEPGFGLNSKSLVLFLSLFITVGVINYVWEGGQALVARRRFRVAAAMKVFPAAIVIAIAFVILCRLVECQPPIIYGFVAAYALLAPAKLGRRESGEIVLFPALALLALSLIAWGLMVPLRELSEGSGDWWVAVPGETAALLFLAGITGILFSLIPVKFIDGAAIYEWNRLIWLALFGTTAFVFSWFILNPEAKALDSLMEGRVVMALSLAAAFFILTLATWLFFEMQEAGWFGPTRRQPAQRR